jgi:hypothetical protein
MPKFQIVLFLVQKFSPKFDETFETYNIDPYLGTYTSVYISLSINLYGEGSVYICFPSIVIVY